MEKLQLIGEHNKGEKMAKHIPEQVELTNMCMIVDEKNNKVLVQKRTKHNWDGMAFPGGHVEKGESVIRSTIREVKEETNLDISNLQCVGFKDWFIDEADKRYFVFLFKTSTFSGNLLLKCTEGENMWLTIDELNKLKLANTFDETLDVYLSNSMQELFYEKDVDGNFVKNIIK